MLSVLVLCKSHASSTNSRIAAQVMRARSGCTSIAIIASPGHTSSAIVASSGHSIIYAPVALNAMELVAENCSRRLVCVASYVERMFSSSGVHIISLSTLSVHNKGILGALACADAIIAWRNWQRLCGIRFS
jgi:hypothetical protein